MKTRVEVRPHGDRWFVWCEQHGRIGKDYLFKWMARNKKNEHILDAHTQTIR